jgi:hypothetical protein
MSHDDRGERQGEVADVADDAANGGVTIGGQDWRQALNAVVPCVVVLKVVSRHDADVPVRLWHALWRNAQPTRCSEVRGAPVGTSSMTSLANASGVPQSTRCNWASRALSTGGWLRVVLGPASPLL